MVRGAAGRVDNQVSARMGWKVAGAAGRIDRSERSTLGILFEKPTAQLRLFKIKNHLALRLPPATGVIPTLQQSLIGKHGRPALSLIPRNQSGLHRISYSDFFAESGPGVD